MKRRDPARIWPAYVWILLPLALGLLYALVHSWIGPTPDPTNMPPEDAVLVFRYRDFDAVDEHHVFTPPPVSWSTVIGVENNVPGLPGVDRSQPYYEIKLPPNLRRDTTMVVFPLADPKRFERAFLDPELIEKGRTRKPKQLKIHGSWAAVGPDRESVNQVGTGDLVCEDRGETWSLAVDVERLAQLALSEADQLPWAPALAALGIDMESVELEVSADGSSRAVFPDAGRLIRIVKAWRRLRLWSYAEERRIELELEPNASIDWSLDLRSSAAPHAAAPSPPASDARLWLWIPGGDQQKLLASVLHACGVDLPDAWVAQDTPTSEGGLLVFGARSAADPGAVTLGVVAPEGGLPDLEPLLGPLPGDDETRPLAEGDAPLTMIDTKFRRPSPAGEVRYRRRRGVEMVGIGASTLRALDRMEAQLALETPFTPPEPPGSGWSLVAAFYMAENQAGKVLGDALDKGGLLHSLSSGAIEGALWTNGRILRLTARATTTR